MIVTIIIILLIIIGIMIVKIIVILILEIIIGKNDNRDDGNVNIHDKSNHNSR